MQDSKVEGNKERLTAKDANKLPDTMRLGVNI